MSDFNFGDKPPPQEPPRRARRVDAGPPERADDRARDGGDRDRGGRRGRDRDDRYDDEPQPSKSNGLALAALILGVLSFLCAFLAGIPAMICGFLGLSQAKKTGTGKGMALAGLILGCIGSTICTGGGIYGLYYSKGKVEEAADRSVMVNNMKQVGIGVNNFHDGNAKLPAPDFVEFRNPDKPIPLEKRLSWRVQILPYVEQGLLFSRFNRSGAWDQQDPSLAQTRVSVYADPNPNSGPDTRIRVFEGGDALFYPDAPGQLSFGGVRDGLSNTIMAAEAADKVPWPQHNELKFDPNGPLPKLGKDNASGFLVLMADGSVKYVTKKISPNVLKMAITANGKENLPPNWFE